MFPCPAVSIGSISDINHGLKHYARDKGGAIHIIQCAAGILIAAPF